MFLRTAEKVTSEAEKSEMRRTVKEAIVFVLPFIHLFALSLWSGHRYGEFFCASSVTMSFFSRFKSAPAVPAANGLTQNHANAAMVKALHNVANVKLRNALKAAKNAANAAKNGTFAERNKTIAELQAAINAAKPVVTAAANVAPNIPVEPATQSAEAQANNSVNSLIKNIANTKFNTNNKKNVKVNNIKSNSRYSNVEENRIQAAIANRRKMIAMFN